MLLSENFSSSTTCREIYENVHTYVLPAENNSIYKICVTVLNIQASADNAASTCSRNKKLTVKYATRQRTESRRISVTTCLYHVYILVKALDKCYSVEFLYKSSQF